MTDNSNNPYAGPPAGSTPSGSSPYGATTPEPSAYGQAGAYGQAPADGESHSYGQAPAYGQVPAYGQGSGPTATAALAPWGKRVLASVLDGLLTLPGALLMTIGAGVMASGSGTSTVDPTTGEILTTGGDQGMITTGLVLVGVGWLLALVIQIYNRWVRGGRGQSWGKKVAGTWLVSERTGQPIGTGMAFVRDLAHYLDSMPLYLGYLWPLWDERRQTFADKMCGTGVTTVPPRQS